MEYRKLKAGIKRMKSVKRTEEFDLIAESLQSIILCTGI